MVSMAGGYLDAHRFLPLTLFLKRKRRYLSVDRLVQLASNVYLRFWDQPDPATPIRPPALLYQDDLMFPADSIRDSKLAAWQIVPARLA